MENQTEVSQEISREVSREVSRGVSREVSQEVNAEGCSYGEVARRFGISIATVRNWVKLGHLSLLDQGVISSRSIEAFASEAIGVSKLTSRANKSYKQSGSCGSLSLDDGAAYEASLPESYRNQEGIYYTPQSIAEDMLRAIDGEELQGKIFLDPCCGSGNFLIAALERGVEPQNIYGYDIDPNAVKIARRRLALAMIDRSEGDIAEASQRASKIVRRSIKTLDFLDRVDSIALRADYIFTNPPWGRRLERCEHRELTRRYNNGGSMDSSALFFMAALSLLREGGKIGFLVQEALFNIGSYEYIRRHIMRYHIDSMVDYGRAFKGILTKAQAIVMTKTVHQEGEEEEYPILCSTATHGVLRGVGSFRVNPQCIFNFGLTTDESRVIERILSRDYITLAGRAKWGLGIVTGDNERLCSPTCREGYIEIFRGSNITPKGFSPATRFIDPDLELYQQSAPREIYEAPSKLIYKFISTHLCFLCDTEQRYVLNSANIVIPDDDFPVSQQQLSDLFNSDFMDWLFRSIFSTHKILRSNLESLPIFADYFAKSEFDEEEYLKFLGVERSGKDSYRLCEAE